MWRHRSGEKDRRRNSHLRKPSFLSWRRKEWWFSLASNLRSEALLVQDHTETSKIETYEVTQIILNFLQTKSFASYTRNRQLKRRTSPTGSTNKQLHGWAGDLSLQSFRSALVPDVHDEMIIDSICSRRWLSAIEFKRRAPIPEILLDHPRCLGCAATRLGPNKEEKKQMRRLGDSLTRNGR